MRTNKASPRVSRIGLLVGSVTVSIVCSANLAAQCAMCRTALTSSAEGQRWSRGINGGIMLLLLAPFLIVGLIALRIYARPVNAAFWGMWRRCEDAIRWRPRRDLAKDASMRN